MSIKTHQTEQNGRFNDMEIAAIVRFANALNRVHMRLIKEGYTFKDGAYVAPAVDEVQPSG